MNTIDQNYVNLADYLRKHKDLLEIDPEMAQIDGTISCAKDSKHTVAICGKEDSHFDHLLELVTGRKQGWNEILYTVPFKVVYGTADSVKYLADGQVKEADSLKDLPESGCEFVELQTDDRLLENTEILFVTLLQGNERRMFDYYISSCESVILVPNLSNAIAIEYHTLCELIRDEWQRPQCVHVLTLAIGVPALPGIMVKALAENLGTSDKIPYKNLSSLTEVAGNRAMLLELMEFDNAKQGLLMRINSSIDSARKKADECLERYREKERQFKEETDSLVDKISGMRAQSTINLPQLGKILDYPLKQKIFKETQSYIDFLQQNMDNELQSLIRSAKNSRKAKEEMEAYVPMYYSALISGFIQGMMSSVLIPAAQEKFDEIIDDILDYYQSSFHSEIPEDLRKKSEIAKADFLSFVDRTRVDKGDLQRGVIEEAITVVILSTDQYWLLFLKPIITDIVYVTMTGVVEFYKKNLQSLSSFTKQVCDRYNEELNKNLQTIPQQIQDVLFPEVEVNMRKAMENFAEEAAGAWETNLSDQKQELRTVQEKIHDIENIQSELDGLMKKCN